MRSRLMIAAGLLLLASRMAMAQAAPQPQPQAPAAPGPTVPSLGSIDFGFRGTDTELDGPVPAISQPAKRRGVPVPAGQRNALVPLYREHVQRRVPRPAIRAWYDRSRLNFDFLWIQIPTNYSSMSVSHWAVGDDGVLTIGQSSRQRVPSRTAVGVPCAPGAPPASCSNPTQAAAALSNRSIYNQNLLGFEIRSRRDTAAFGLRTRRLRIWM